LSRRHLLKYAAGTLGTVVVAGAAGFELVSHGVLPGKATLDGLDGACDVPSPHVKFYSVGPSLNGSYFSEARNTTVGYTVAYPPGHKVGDSLSLIVDLHGLGGDHLHTTWGITPAQALAIFVDGALLPPMGMVTVDGGSGYWNPHPRDNPMAMVVDEVIPMCQKMGLGRAPDRIGTMGVSMGGYGALLFAEKYPLLFSAVAAISPAIWTSYQQARSVDAGAYASSADFESADVVTHAPSLAGIPVRVASGASDPFHPGVLALAQRLPADAVVISGPGCHTSPYIIEQQPSSLAFLGKHLVTQQA
jgi:pimeloyl-ACP methyl ester carboxylesterase